MIKKTQNDKTKLTRTQKTDALEYAIEVAKTPLGAKYSSFVTLHAQMINIYKNTVNND